MTILNRTQLEASIASLTTGGVNTAAELRQVLTNEMDSLAPYGGVMSDGVTEDIAVPAGVGNADALDTFNNNDTPENALLRPDQANSVIHVKEPALYFFTTRFNGRWPTNVTLAFGIYVNGAINAVTPVAFQQKGQGLNDPILLSVTRVAFVINDAMIAAGVGGEAQVQLFKWSTGAGFNMDQDDVTFGGEYNQLTIDAVG